MSQTRQLAAIMFTDIVGYTALMGEDEQKAFQTLIKNRELQKPIIEKYGGRWIKELGDGVLASFGTVSDAVYAAKEIQQQCVESCDFSIRIGIHLGEIIFESNDVFGDAVNVASRIQAIAPIGGIFVSETVHHDIANKTDVQTRFIKAEKLKNVKGLIRIYEVLTGTNVAQQKRKFTKPIIKVSRRFVTFVLIVVMVIAGLIVFLNKSKEWFANSSITSIAVLPFTNETGVAEMEYLSDGMTETLINSLSQMQDLSVKARSLVFHYKKKNIDPIQVGNQLSVQAVLIGRVLERGDNILLHLELVDVRKGDHVWGEQYNRRASELPLLQSEIAKDVADKLKIRLSRVEEKSVTKNYTQNAQAYQHYLKGRFHWNKRTDDGLKKALKEFQKAIEYDPNYALAYSGLADSYCNMQGYAGTPASEVWPLARAAAERAVQLDNSLAEAHASLGLVYYQGWQWTDAERELQRSIELNPRYASAYHWYSLWLQVMGKSDEALQMMRRAQELDPLAPVISTNVAGIYLMLGYPDSAFIEYQKILQLSPTFGGYGILGRIYLAQKDYQKAIKALQQSVELTERGSGALTVLGYVYATAGYRSDALSIARELEKKYSAHQTKGASVAAVYAGLNEREQVFAWLEKDYQERSGTLGFAIRGYPYFKTMETDPRLKSILKRMGLPE